MINVCLIISLELSINSVIEIRYPLFVNPCAVVLKQSHENLLLCCLIPSLAIISKFDITFLWVILWSLNLQTVDAQSP